MKERVWVVREGARHFGVVVDKIGDSVYIKLDDGRTVMVHRLEVNRV